MGKIQVEGCDVGAPECAEGIAGAGVQSVGPEPSEKRGCGFRCSVQNGSQVIQANGAVELRNVTGLCRM